MVAPAMGGLLVLTPRRAHADALAMALEVGFGFRHVVGATSHADAVSHATLHRPSLVLVDFAVEDLAACLRAMRRVAPAVPLVVYGVSGDEGTGERLIHAAQAGASSFIDAEHPLAELLPALEVALSGQSYCSPRVAGILLRAIHLIRDLPTGESSLGTEGGGSILSHRERVVAELVVTGLTNRQIATRLVVSEATVKSHVHAILGKLGIARREEVKIWFHPTPAAEPTPPRSSGADGPVDPPASIVPAPARS